MGRGTDDEPLAVERPMPLRLASSEGLDRIFCKRQLQNDFAPVNSTGVSEAQREVEGLRAARARNVRELQTGEQAFVADMLDNLKQCGTPDATTLERGVNHEAPDSDLRQKRRRRKKGFVFEHYKAYGFFVKVNGAIPSLWCEKRLSQGYRVWCDKLSLAVRH